MSQFFYKFKSFALQIHHNFNQLLREGKLREQLFYLEERIKKTSNKMEDLQKLMLQKEMLLIELNSLERKIQLLSAFKAPEKPTMVSDEPESSGLKSKASPEQTVSGKDLSNPLMDDAFPKSMKNVIVSTDKDTTSPVQTVAGKDSTNLLMAVALPKSKLAELPEINLRPSWADILENKNISKKDDRFYVVYNGEKPGIYTNWGIVSKIVSGKLTSFKKFSNIEKARLSAEDYTKIHGGEILLKETVLIPKTTWEKPVVKKPVLLKKEEKTTLVEISELTKFDFTALWLKARNAGKTDFVYENFFTIDKKSKSLYNFCEGADKNLVHLAYQAGLVKHIYPSNNLLELNLFEEGFKKAVKNFRTKIAKTADAKIYLSITSSIPDWENDNVLKPYYFIEIGLVNNTRDFPPMQEIAEENDPKDELLDKIRTDSLRTIISKINEISEKSKIKINYFAENCLMTSWCPNLISKEDKEKVERIQRSFNDNTIMVGPTTKKRICQQMTKTFSNHKCPWCGPEESKCDAESSSTEDKD